MKLADEVLNSFGKKDIEESNTIDTANAISKDLTKFLKNIVIPKSKGFVSNERDAAGHLIDILKHKYNF